jgi:TonB-linked SusC/RagA family outer membrane protein
MAEYENIKVKNRDYTMTGNVALGIKLAPFLNFKASYGYRGSFNSYHYHTPPFTPSVQDRVLYAMNSARTTYWQEQVQENILTLNKGFGQHEVNMMVGNSINATYSEWHGTSVDGSTGGFLDPNLETIDAGIGGSFSGDGSNFTYNRASFFGRLNYAFAHKYLFQVTARRDGSSKFGSKRRWGFFPSAAIGWVISKEGFFPKDGIINNLKFRASYGRLGNESALGYYDFQTLVTTVNNKSQGYVQGVEKLPWPGSIATGLANSDLQWETTDSKNIGFDLGLFNNKLTGTVNYYNSTTSDLLITKILAPSAGMDDPTLNVGKIRNSGVEFDFQWKEKKGDFTYNIGMNLSTVKNEVLELANNNQIIYGTGLKYGDAHFPTKTQVGSPIGAFYLYQMDGIFQNEQEVQDHYTMVDGQKVVIQPDAKPGDVRFRDLNGDGNLDNEDMAYSGSGIPKVEANLILNLNWKGLDFSSTLGSAWGAKIYNGNRYFYEAMSSGSNFLSTTVHAWTEQNHSNTMPRAVLGDPNGNTRESTRFLENGNFVKVRQIQLGYSLPKRLISGMHLNKLRVYASANNVFTFTDYSGIDPEFSRSSVLNAGVDNYIFPFTRSFLMGVQITL